MHNLAKHETLDLGICKIMVHQRAEGYYEFSINNSVAHKHFASKEEAKRVALESVLNRLHAASEHVKVLLGK